ncbi:MAG: hypothetical protein KAQ63_00460 [Candidatus Moranbacteria bacterium]|nr:hypothetical protein [Candidatus Moranbacteria bacterium]
MKRKASKENSCCCEEAMENFKKQVKVKFREAQKYAKKNPQKTKTILTGVGAVLTTTIAFLIGKKGKNKNRN